jgi:hypothetical protein
MDFVTGLHTTAAGYDSIFVVVDRLTKMVHLAPTHTTITAQGAAALFVQHDMLNMYLNTMANQQM